MLSRARIRSLVESEGALVVAEKLCESIRDGAVKPQDVSILTLAEGFLGEDVVREWRQTRGGFVSLAEAGDPVSLRAFSNTIGGIVMSAVESGYRRPGFIGDQLVSVVPSRNRYDRIAFPGDFEGTNTDINEGEELPSVGFGERYVDTPDTTKKGAWLGVTKEMILADDSGKVVEHAGMIGEYVGELREIKILQAVLGITNTYKENGTSYNTYLTSGAWVNSSSNVLVDRTQIETAEIALQNILNPVSGKPIMSMPDTIIVPGAKNITAKSLVASAEIETRTNTQTNVVRSANPNSHYAGRVFTSPWIVKLLVDSGVSASNAANYWYLGESRRAFHYHENWALQVRPIGPDPTREVELRFAASERGACAVREPRAMYRSTN